MTPRRSGHFTPTTALATVFIVSASACQAQHFEPREFQSDAHDFRLERVVGDLRQPWGMTFLPDGRILVTEIEGRLRIIENDTLVDEPVSGVPEVWVSGQGGLLDVAAHPQFEDIGWIYLSYSAPPNNEGSTTQVMRARLGDSGLEDHEVLHTSVPRSFASRHFGSRILFDRTGDLYVSTGDRAEMDRAQDPNDFAGTIIRLRDNGDVPEDNPFVNDGTARPEIYVYGVRNPQGLALHPETGEVWAHEHGPRGGDEVNVIRAGANYGWPEITYGIGYSGLPITSETSAPGMEQPIYYWDPSIAPSGMTFYTGSRFPEWQGDIFVGALKYQLVVRLDVENGEIVGEERLIEDEIGRIRDLEQGPDGNIYILTDEIDGGLYRLVPVSNS
ncbi:MAG: PQQ-dependent sugar dehydrogenase [Pseudomonadota bacterium]